MARKEIKMEELVEVLYQWHKGQNIRWIKRSVGMDRKTIRKYMNICYPKQERNCLRLEVKPGEESQVDFGSAGKMYDPKTGQNRRAHAFVMTLSYSRLPFVEFVFDQGQAT